MWKYIPKKLKIILISILSLVIITGVAIICWYLSINWGAEDKKVSKTFYVGELVLADGTQQDIIEIEYFANTDNSGYEAFEIKYNYFMDETRTKTYSQGFQYIADKGYPIEFGAGGETLFIEKKPFRTEGAWFWAEKHYNTQIPSSYSNLISCYNYMYNGFEYVKSTNPINKDSCFKINLNQDVTNVYLMEFKGANEYDALGNLIENTPMNSDTACGSSIKFGDFDADIVYHSHYVYDAQYFSRILYEAVKSSSLGASGKFVFEFGNLFNYYKYNAETGQYDENRTNYDDALKIEDDIKSYYSIKVTTHENGLSCAEESMFGSILGNQNFNLNGDYSSGDYFIGKTIVDCDISAFDFVIVEDNNIAFKLSEAFINYYNQYKSSIALSIVIDLDLINELGYNFVGFTTDNGLDIFNILECYTTSNGEIVQDYTNALGVLYE